MKTKIMLVGALTVALAWVAILLSPGSQPISPLGAPTNSETTKVTPRSYVILGFAPYWNLKKLSKQSYDGITHFAYFALHLNDSGEIFTHTNPREEDPGYTNYRRLLQHSLDIPAKPLILTIMPIDEDALRNILSSSSARSKAVSTIVQSLHESGATGVNIDFEPLGDISATTRNNFTLFVQELRSQLPTEAWLISVSIYASAGSRPRLWDLVKLNKHVDHIVVMTYDYTMPITERAGPNSPLRDAGANFEHNITKNIAEITLLVPTEKVLLGIPLYGYEWDTVDESKYAPTESRGTTASLERIEQMLAERTLSLLWDRNSLTAYGVASSSGQTSQIYFENETSLRLKLEFVKAANLGGIALWALGYDRDVPWLWPTIGALNKRP